MEHSPPGGGPSPRLQLPESVKILQLKYSKTRYTLEKASQELKKRIEGDPGGRPTPPPGTTILNRERCGACPGCSLAPCGRCPTCATMTEDGARTRGPVSDPDLRVCSGVRNWCTFWTPRSGSVAWSLRSQVWSAQQPQIT